MSGRRADGGPALPGATVADAAAGGMHAAIAILAALLRRTRTRARRVPRRLRRGGRALADGAAASTSISRPAPIRDPVTTCSAAATPATGSTGRATTSGSPSARSRPPSGRTCAARSASSAGSRTSTTTRSRSGSAPICPPPSATRDRDAWVARARARGHLRGAGALGGRAGAGSAVPGARRDRSRSSTRSTAASDSSRRCSPARRGPQSVVRVRGAEASDAEPLLRAAGYAPREIEALLGAGTVA